MFRSLQTSESRPSCERSRLTPPTSTPSVVESMNVVSEKSTTTSLAPSPITFSRCCLNSGAVYRSTSPASEMTYVPSSTLSVFTSKFICPPSRGSLTAAEPAGLELVRKERELLLRVSDVRIVGGELDEAPVGPDRERVEAGLGGVHPDL